MVYLHHWLIYHHFQVLPLQLSFSASICWMPGRSNHNKVSNGLWIKLLLTSLMDCLSFSGRDFFFGNIFDKILLLVFFGALKLKGIMIFHTNQSMMLTSRLIELSSSLALALFFAIKNCHALTALFAHPDHVISPPSMPSAMCSLCWQGCYFCIMLGFFLGGLELYSCII